ncbi:Glucuronosyltransferase [Aphelenchoides besseyi]|nr:Glucuronosyltransferase [Aphelenchoides besseyi]
MDKISHVLTSAGHTTVQYIPSLCQKTSSLPRYGRVILRECDFQTDVDLSVLSEQAWNNLQSFGNLFQLLHKYVGLIQTSCEHLLQDNTTIEMLRNEKFDIAMSEIMDPCGFMLMRKAGIKKSIALHASYLPIHWQTKFGLPASLSFVPDMQTTVIPPFSFVERVKAQLFYWFGHFVIYGVFRNSYSQLEYLVEDNYNVEDAICNASFLMVNTDEFVEFPRPISHKIISIAGIDMAYTLKNRKGLDKHHHNLLENSAKGVVLVSFGSVASSCKMPNETKQSFLEMFAAFPEIDFIWKYEADDGIGSDLKNLMTEKWIPQPDLLSHPKLLAFITHAGMNSITEATYLGVPLIAIPLFGDQPRNAAMIRRKKVGVVVEKKNLTAISLIEAVRSVVYNPIYKENAQKLAEILAAKTSPDERLVKYTEFAARFDVHEHLDLPGRHLSVVEYYNLDVLTFVFISVSLFIFTGYKLLRLFKFHSLKMLLRQLICLLLCVTSTCGLKFFFYNPRSTRSHVNFVNKIITVLTDAGHEVVSYNPEISKDFGSTYNHKTARVIEWEVPFEPKVSVDNLNQNEWEMGSSMSEIMGEISRIFKHFGKACDYQLRDEKLMERLRAEKFDLGLSEFFDACGFGIMKKIGLNNTVGMMTTTLPPIAIGMLGLPSMSSFVPDMTMPLIPPFGFIGRLKIQLINIIGRYISFNYILSSVQDAFNAHNLHITIDSAFADSSLFLINNDELIDFPQPISYKMIPIAGVGLAKNLANPKKLEKNLQQAFDSSTKGVVYISFGSVANAYKMPLKTKQAFLDAVRAFPDITFLFKYERDDLTEGKPNNLILSKWFSQPDILAQPKLLAFVTHAGGNSMTEAHFSGVPVVAIPLFTDQPRNALLAKFRGVGIVVSKQNITRDALIEAIHEITTNASYKQNAINLAKMVRDKPMNADERVLKYLTFAAKYKELAKNMDLPGRYMSTIEFYNIDVFAFLFASITFTLLTIVFCVRFAIGLCFRKNQKNKTE